MKIDAALKCLLFTLVVIAVAGFVTVLDGCGGQGAECPVGKHAIYVASGVALCAGDEAPDASDAGVDAGVAPDVQEAGAETSLVDAPQCCLPGYYCPGKPLCDAAAD